jgi:hypothetical protein
MVKMFTLPSPGIQSRRWTQIALIARWADAGAPRGSTSQEPDRPTLRISGPHVSVRGDAVPS